MSLKDYNHNKNQNKKEIIMSGFSSLNPNLVCPHCQTKGFVHTMQVKKKKGISGAKATAAILTGGWSLLATGLSKKDMITEAHCDNCGTTWHFE
jgi:transcription elongation factor Elf1